jgi:hypothetical protein
MSGPGIEVNHLPDIGAEKPIFTLKMLLVNLFKFFKMILYRFYVYSAMGQRVTSNTAASKLVGRYDLDGT